MPVLWDSTELKQMQALFLGNTVVPCWVVADAGPGNKCFWEQRDWLATVGVRNLVDFRKQETRRNVLARVISEFGLDESDVSIPSQHVRAVSTVLLSSRGLISWLLLRRSMTDAPSFGHRSLQWASCLEGFSAFLDQDAGDYLAGRPTLSAHDVTMEIHDGKLDVTAMVRAWPSFPSEWDALRGRSQSLLLPPFPSSGIVRLSQLLLFLDGRIRGSVGMPGDHWMRAARTACVSICGFLVDALALRDIEWGESKVGRLPAPDRYGATGQRRVHRSFLPRVQRVRQLLATCGSDAAVMDALLGQGRGKAAQIRAVSNVLYNEAARDSFASARRVSVGWDGSTHGGHDVQLGYALDVQSKFAAYIRPTASCLRPLTLETCRTAPLGGSSESGWVPG